MMKKYIIPLCVAALVAVACTMEEEDCPVVTEATSPLTLTGYSCVDTRVSIGEKDGETYPLLWYTGDAININSADGTTWTNKMAVLYSGSSGESSGLFQTEEDLYPETDMDLLILYPGYTMEYYNGIINGSVPMTQSQRSGNSSIHVGNSCFAYAEASIKAGQTEGVTFTLEQKTAFVKVIIKEIPEYSDYYLLGATLHADGHDLAGDISYKYSDKSMTVENASETVGATISNPTKISGEQAVYFTAIPCDLKGEQVLLTVLMTGNTGNETVSIPLYIDGGVLRESCLSIIEVDSIDALPAWYDPVETRDLMDGWAYGKQNTYFIEQKDSENSITIDVRARGDFSKVKEPKYYALVSGSCEHIGNNGEYTKHTLCYLSTYTAGWADENNNCSEYVYDTVSSDYTITVYCFADANGMGDGKWAVVGIFDEDYNILWSFMVWKYHTGDEPKEVAYNNSTVLLDRIIGAEYSNSKAEELGTFNPPAGALFQWGRKDPFPYLPNSSNTTWNNGYYSVSNMVVNSLAASIANPTVSYINSNGADWIFDENELELWGGPTVSEADAATAGKGHKTIYDPCPAGWRVCDANIMYDVFANGERWESPCGETTAQTSSVLNENSPFYKELGDYDSMTTEEKRLAGGESVLAYKMSSGDYDYWPYNGFHYNTTSAGWNSALNGNIWSLQTSCEYWSSSLRSENDAIGLRYFYYSTSLAINTNFEGRVTGCAVRCMKDDENR